MTQLTQIELDRAKMHLVTECGQNFRFTFDTLKSKIFLNKKKDLGTFAPMIKEVTIEATIQPFDYSETGGNKGYYIWLSYRYVHPSGQNGYTANCLTLDGGEKFTDWK